MTSLSVTATNTVADSSYAESCKEEARAVAKEETSIDDTDSDSDDDDDTVEGEFREV